MMVLPVFKRNMVFLTFLSLVWAWQVLLALSFILSHVPPGSSLTFQVLPEWRYLLKPEWKPLIFHLVVLSAVLFQAVLLWTTRRQIKITNILRNWKVYAAAEMAVTFLWTSAAFQMIIYADRPDLARDAFVVLMVLAFLCKITSPRLQGWAGQAWEFVVRLSTDRGWSRVAEWAMPVGIIVLLFIPNIKGIVARMFIGEQFHHNDSFIMGPALAHLSGQILDVDVISQYGIGFVVILSRLAQGLGGLTYEHVLGTMVVLTVLYYLAWYAFVRRVLGSVWLACAAVLLGIKWQMFNSGAYPLVFTYGSMTPIRFLYDIVYLWCVWMHIETRHKGWLAAGACSCGLGIYYMTSEGMYATASFIAYVIFLAVLPGWRARFGMGLRDLFMVFVPPLAALVLLAVTIGGDIFTGPFWGNVREFINYFISGFGLEPVYKNLQDRKFLEELMGFVIPWAYVLTLLVSLGRLALDAAEDAEWIMIVLCLYGLGTFHYYVARPTGTSYDAVCLPFVIVLGFWAKVVMAPLKPNRRLAVNILLTAAAFWALVTTHMFLSYPNIVNLSRNPLTDPKVALPLPANRGPYFNHLFRHFDEVLKLPANDLGTTDEGILAESDFKDDAQLVDYYRRNGDFSKDADLIASLTGRSDEVPLISSFEIKMLMQADRKPFFYYFPLLISRPMGMRMFETCSIYTTDQLAKTLQKFETDKPPFVFMEKIFMVKEVPGAYLFWYPSLIPLVNYVRTHYEPYEQGQYLIALKRKVV